MPERILTIAGLDAFYGDFQALYGVDMTVAQGEVLAIIGANGAGKTTLLRSISGLIRNEAAQIRFRDRAIGAERPDMVARMGLAMVPEGRQLFPSLSVEENLLIGGRVGRPGPWSLRRVYELFPILEERRHQASTSLSGGQQQMVAIGRALMSNPDLIMFDEISLGLAPVIIRDIYAALAGIVGGGMSAIIVEQDITKALSVSSRVYCLQEGRVSLEGRSDSISREEITRAYFGVA
ncbi:ABC transporter ATP-binding protein (plasmid) [Pacificitalea manganoxidans]|jgi:branched-chain amino acid transport system ATP-binding protein|uniref:ABC transporter ATP-binding protein n=1 Tax=Pacificitalea manganoxidans TaxID=1411902 RepID=A0A291LZP3_9RHOB|nr:ABC transporter ATP-binding protein [Pacificitalea manganoxidans]MAQ45320.1 ABC transporter ATP-binding protein [Actibacterium sp.]OWU66453.1 ABC transporter ATP-binding protein [Roseovarius sp. 22II1-1F6A]ATI41988.1 ABC transporter ATP-binding protein [Pacificitalea manganoxidans]ATI43911.1 ABC transporter ATP-binding protein [Pacificitalea manganoxidans]MDR6309481.1 branched-chain amino acid transport system ATP-binding protein [Pacificitalea manganoxidans]|tara:strand:- start:1290 stop:1997 length:708 start_codon:yes stop_codon:yes gene_type:complete